VSVDRGGKANGVGTALEVTQEGQIRSYITPWRTELFLALAKAQHELLLVCPFIKSTVVRGIREILSPQVEVRTISRFLEREFRQGVSDLEAHYWLSGHDGAANFELRRLDNVHAKVFIVDRRIAFVGSSNLTLSGLLRNFESTVRIEDPTAVSAILNQMEALWERRPSVHADALASMAMTLRRPPVEVISREEEEHVYADVPGAPFSQSAEIDFRPVQEALPFVPVAASPVELPAVPVAITVDDQPAAPAAREAKLQPRSRIEEIAYLVSSFQDALRARFGAIVEPGIEELALAVRTEDLRSYADKAKSIDVTFDREAFFNASLESMENAGRAAYELACFSVAIKSGLLNTYGIPAVEYFQREAELPVHLLRHWDRALLGPIPSSGNSPASTGQRTRAARRLFGLFVKALGFDQAMEIIEDGFNPLDAVAADIDNVLSVRNPKSTLQEVVAVAGGKPPSYDDASSEGPDHERVWTCRLKVGKFSAEGTGDNKAEAEVDAAGRILRLMEADEGWGIRLETLRSNFFERARRDRPVPLYPRVSVPKEFGAELSATFQARMGFTVSAEQLATAVTSPEARLRLRQIDADNRTLAAIGARLVQLVTALVADRERLEGIRVGPTLTETLVEWLGVERLTALLRMKQTARQTQEVAQAIIAAVFLERGFSFLSEWLGAEISRWGRSQASEMPTHGNLKEWLVSHLVEYRDGVGYTTALQNIQQAERKPPAVFVESRTGPDHSPVFEARSSWDGLVGRGAGANRKAARQRAAYELLKLLRDRMDG